MYLGMFTFTLDKFEVFYSIIKSITVNVVDNFCRFKVSTKVFFHYKSMLSNIPTYIGEGVFMCPNESISASNMSTTFPPKAIFGRHNLTLVSVLTFIRTRFTTSVFYAICLNLKRTVAYYALSDYIFHENRVTDWDLIASRSIVV